MWVLEQEMDFPKQLEEADKTEFVMSAEHWQAFTEALDQPPRHLLRLEKLLQEPSILDGTTQR